MPGDKKTPEKGGNVVKFTPRGKKTPTLRTSSRKSGAKRKGSSLSPKGFERHEKVLKVKFTGPEVDGVFAQAVADRAQLLGMDGWVRVRGHDGSVDALFAGDAGGIQRIFEFVRGGGEGPTSMVRIEEKPLRGDEPIWTEFHLLPPT